MIINTKYLGKKYLNISYVIMEIFDEKLKN